MLCGVSLLERILRIAQRLGFREATILCDSIELLKTHLAAAPWARAQMNVRFARLAEIREQIKAPHERLLIVSASFYYDARLLRALAERETTTLLGDAAALVDRNWISQESGSTAPMDQLACDAAAGRIQVLDVAREPTYIANLRKHCSPIVSCAVSPEGHRVAERHLKDAAQNGTLDFPAMIHAPIETWLVSKVCRTAIRPNQITFVTMLVGLAVTGFFATGQLLLGTVLALAVGVLDGVDGKLARTKIETTELGQWSTR